VHEAQKGATAQVLERIRLEVGRGSAKKETYNENWLQELIFTHPYLLPVEEIEPAFFPHFPVCRELPNAAGYLDNLYVSEAGNLTLVECKLWRNPEARREVIGQVLDYAKEFSRWSYEDLDAAVKQASGMPLFSIIRSEFDGIDEAEFVDKVSRNLRLGRFLLLVVGDGIREGVENMATFLQQHAGIDFTFGLVELAVYRLPDKQGLLVQPRVLAQTYAIERAVVRSELGGITLAEPAEQKVTHKELGRRTTISQEQFFEALSKANPQLVKQLPSFLDQVGELDLAADFGSSSLNLRWLPDGDLKMNFGSIHTDGTVKTDPSNWVPNKIGRVDIAHGYQQELAAIVPGASVHQHENPDHWRVVKDGNSVPLQDLLNVRQKWFELIQRIQGEVRDALT
jgi:hypothetical protein